MVHCDDVLSNLFKSDTIKIADLSAHIDSLVAVYDGETEMTYDIAYVMVLTV